METFVMHPFAIGQVWGLYEDGKLTKSFRMEDGSFITEKQEKMTLPDSSQEQPDIRCVGPMTDSRNVYTYFRKDSEIAMETVLNFSGSFLGEEDEDVTVENVEFYHLSQPSEGGDSREAEQSVCPLKDVPDRYFSEIVLHISKALAT